MNTQLHCDILPQPDDTTCGPTCLHAIYRYFGDTIPLGQVIAETTKLKSGGTLAVYLANHALQRGYGATIYTYNLRVFDPSWFREGATPDIRDRLLAQARAKGKPKISLATKAYIDFLDLGGTLRFEDLTGSLLRRYLKRELPVIAGLSSTYLYRDKREIGETGEEDDIRGEPAGHFVVLCGYNQAVRKVYVADPYLPNPLGGEQRYSVGMSRLIGAILLGVLTHDANILIIMPGNEPTGEMA